MYCWVWHTTASWLVAGATVSTSHTLLSLYLQYKYIVSGSSKYKYNRVYFGKICTKSRMSSRPADFTSQRCRLERARHHRPPEEAQITQLSLTDGYGLLARVYNECGGRQSRSWIRVAVAPHKTPNTSWRNDFSIATLSRALIPATMSTLLPYTTLPAIWLARGLRVAWVNCISAAETGFCTKSCTSDEQTPRPPSPAYHKTFRPAHQCNSFAIPLTLRCTRVWSSNVNTQLRGTQGLNTESLTMPAAVADPKRSLDS